MYERPERYKNSRKEIFSSKEPVFNLPSNILILIVLCCLVYSVQTYFLTPEQNVTLLKKIAFIPARYSLVGFYDIWFFASPFTSFFLHGNFAHLAINMLWLAAVGTPLAWRIGTIRLILFSMFLCIGSVFAYALFNPFDPTPVIGASGVISGMMAVAPRFLFRVDRFSSCPAYAGASLSLRQAFSNSSVLYFFSFWIIGNFLIGFFNIFAFEGSIAWEAHIGGFLSGFFFFPFFDRSRK